MLTAKDVLKQEIEFAHMLVGYYIADLSDADLLVRSTPGTNHIAWQLGHIIAGVGHMLQAVDCQAPPLPAGFAAAYTKETAGCDDPAKFATKAEYLRLLGEAKAASLKAVDQTPDDRLEQPSPEAMREYAPTVAAVLALSGNHLTMHAGQFVPIRRKLGKPPLF
jgi:uncharacterized damage-inducible protein DinB